eukprot:6987674-Pyramimonas_sp.AAC.1
MYPARCLASGWKTAPRRSVTAGQRLNDGTMTSRCLPDSLQRLSCHHTSPDTASVAKPATESTTTARSTAASSRTWILGSGSARHSQDKADAAPRETTDVHQGHKHILDTANGDRIVNERTHPKLPHIGLPCSALPLDDSPSVLSVGQLVQDRGFRQI